MAGKTLGLCGFGAIARETARKARALGMEIAGHDPFLPATDAAWTGTKRMELDQLLETSDVVSLHVPLTSATRHMIDAAAIARMKPDAILINAARGGVVDEDALATALKERRLGAAALDCFETEPLTAEAGAKFAGIENLILTAHIAGVTEESNIRVSHMIAEKVMAHLGGTA
jgi:(S)-sulfolactate dehydrogenase